MTSIDFTDLLPVATRLVTSRTRDLTRDMHAAERVEYVEMEAESLAYSLAEVADERLTELRDGLREEMSER
jgi:hypothetical protein